MRTKHLFLGLLACVLFVGLKGQIAYAQKSYIPMASEGAQWIIRYDKVGTPQPVDNLWEYKAVGDTMIDNYAYKKVFKRFLEPTNDAPPFQPIGEYELYGFIRDDSLHRKVYGILLDDNGFCPVQEECLLYDYAVQVGDTASFCLIPDFMNYVLTSITPETYLGYETRRFSNGEGLDYYEGMGSDFGLFEPMFVPVKAGKINPLYRTFLYYYCRKPSCSLVLSVPENYTDERAVQVYPNPASTKVTFELPTMTAKSILHIRDIAGKDVTSIMLTQGQTHVDWDCSHVTSGMYFYQVDIDGFNYSGKVVVE